MSEDIENFLYGSFQYLANSEYPIRPSRSNIAKLYTTKFFYLPEYFEKAFYFKQLVSQNILGNGPVVRYNLKDSENELVNIFQKFQRCVYSSVNRIFLNYSLILELTQRMHKIVMNQQLFFHLKLYFGEFFKQIRLYFGNTGIIRKL
jgi:hypothetical protein